MSDEEYIAPTPLFSLNLATLELLYWYYQIRKAGKGGTKRNLVWHLYPCVDPAVSVADGCGVVFTWHCIYGIVDLFQRTKLINAFVSISYKCCQCHRGTNNLQA